MKSKEFLLKELKEMVDIFPNIKCLYEFDAIDCSHSIEVLPTSFYESNQEFIFLESRIYKSFYEKYPEEGLSFISGETIFPVKPQEILVGNTYKNEFELPNVSSKETFTSLFESSWMFEVNNKLDGSLNAVPNSIESNIGKKQNSSINDIGDISSLCFEFEERAA